MSCTATQQNAETTTEAKLTTTVNEQTSSADGDLSTVTDEASRVTDSQTQTGIHCILLYSSSSTGEKRSGYHRMISCTNA